MNKEELKQEAEDKAFAYADMQDTSTSEWADKKYTYIQIVNAYERGALDFAEPREKRISELEAQIARIIRQDPSLLNEELIINETYRNKVAELEKENAELKDKNKWYSEQVCNKECSEVWEELSEAKELLDKVLRVVHSELHPYQMQPYLEVLKQAENFLKE